MTEATPPAGTSSGGPPAAGEEIGYADALAELEGILDELDGDEVDVDVLGARVRRAAELLRLCRSRIATARFEVEQVVGELEAEADAAASAARRDALDRTAGPPGGEAANADDSAMVTAERDTLGDDVDDDEDEHDDEDGDEDDDGPGGGGR